MYGSIGKKPFSSGQVKSDGVVLVDESVLVVLLVVVGVSVEVSAVETVDDDVLFELVVVDCGLVSG